MTEHTEQSKLIKWASYQQKDNPALGCLFAIPNAGKRSITCSNYYLAEGLKAGVPDLFLAVMRGGYGGLFIEMKRPGILPSEKQKKWHEKLKRQGYFVVVCHGFEEAKGIIERYLK